MFVLIGEGYEVVQNFIGGDFENVDFEERVALFDSEKAGQLYAESLRLAKEKHQSF